MTRLGTKTEVNKMVAAIELAGKEQSVNFDIKKDPEFIKITFKGKNVFLAMKTNGPWLCTYDADLFA